jgi:hypothetical protein
VAVPKIGAKAVVESGTATKLGGLPTPNLNPDPNGSAGRMANTDKWPLVLETSAE